MNNTSFGYNHSKTFPFSKCALSVEILFWFSFIGLKALSSFEILVSNFKAVGMKNP